jgi:hypothetical protein
LRNKVLFSVNVGIFMKNQNIPSCVVNVFIKNSNKLYINEMNICLNACEYFVSVYSKLHEKNITYIFLGI